MSPRALLFGLFATSLVACSGNPDARTPAEAAQTDSSGKVEPASAAEREVLNALSSLPGASERKFAGVSVQIAAPYHSASGRQCRQVTFTGAQSSDVKLACRDEGEWVFVPNVFASSQGH